MTGRKILITAGGTKEEIDPVRYIGNYSSGKMGVAIADNAYVSGADVTLVSTVEIDKPYKVIKVKSADEMLSAVKDEFVKNDVLIMAAAVADYKVVSRADNKIKKENNDTITLELVKNADILKEISKIKTDKQSVIGFCAESQNLIDNAKQKIEAKNLDFIVANDISQKDIGFNSDYNEVIIIDKNGNQTKIPKNTKEKIAKEILRKVFDE